MLLRQICVCVKKHFWCYHLLCAKEYHWVPIGLSQAADGLSQAANGLSQAAKGLSQAANFSDMQKSFAVTVQNLSL